MTSRTEEFFQALGRHGHEPVLAKVTGTIGFEILQGPQRQTWTVTIRAGDITVSRAPTRSDALVRVGREVFDRTVTGEESLFAAMVRGEAQVEGDIALLVVSLPRLPRPADAELRLPARGYDRD